MSRIRNMFFGSNSGSGSSSHPRSLLWGVPLIVVTLLVGLWTPMPARLFALLAVVSVSFVAFYTFKKKYRKVNERIDPMIPTAVVYIAIYFALVPYFDPYGVAGLLFGVFLVMSGAILEKDRKDREPFQQISAWTGALFIGLSIVWIGAVQIGFDDNIKESVQELIESFDEDEPTAEAVKVDKAGVTTTPSIRPKNDGRWEFIWTTRDSNEVAYPVTFRKDSRFHKDFFATWVSAGEDGITEIEISRDGCMNCFAGSIAIEAAGSIPYNQGTVDIKRQSDECFTGSAEIKGVEYPIKLKQKGVRCEVAP